MKSSADRHKAAPPPNASVRIDAEAECIWRGDRKIGVPPKAFAVLLRLMERPQQLVTKNDLLAAVWPGIYVTEVVLNKAVRQLRTALGDDSKQPSFIETVHRRGFRWIASADTPALDKASGDRPAAAPSAFDAPETTAIVGRETSLAQLARCYQLAAAGQRQLILIGGEPGIGKTALVDEFVGCLAQHDPAVLVARGQCIESYGAGDLYRPWREAVEQLLRHASPATRASLLKCAPSWLLALAELLTPAEAEMLRRTVIVPTADVVQRELERAIEAASEQSAVVLILEDLHWSEPATVALLWALATRRQPARLFIVGTYRSVDAIAQQHPIIRLKRELSAKRQCLAIDLEGLRAESILDLLDRLYPNHDVPAALAARLLEQSSGNPLFLLNALADFEARGWLQPEEGRWRWSADLDAIAAAVPESTREMIAFRLDQLPPTTRELVEVASIVGHVFATQTVAVAAERPPEEVEAELEGLSRAAFFLEKGDEVEWPDGRRGCEHRFRHALYRQVAQRSILPSRRQRLHRHIALALEQGYGERSAEIAGALSLHHEQAGDALRAVDYIDVLVQQAYARSAWHAAEPMLAHAVALLKRTPASAERDQRLLTTMTAHGSALAATRGVSDAETLRALAEARALAQALPAALEHSVALGTTAAGKITCGQLREALTLGEEMLSRLPIDTRADLVGDTGLADGSAVAVATAHLAVGTSALHLGRIEMALLHLQQAVDAIGTTTAPTAGYDPAVPAHAFLAYAWVMAGWPEKGRARLETALQLARNNGVPWYLGSILQIASLLAVVRRDPAEARRFATEALAFGAENDLPVWNGAHQTRLGWSEVVESGDPSSLAALRDSADAFRERGLIAVSCTYGALADACLHGGRMDAAAAALDAAFDTRGEERLFDAELLRLRGALAVARAAATDSSLDQAREYFEQAIDLARTQGTRLFGLRATVELGRLARTRDQRQQVQQRLRQALSEFEEGFGETDLREAQTMLTDLARQR
ncbi:MAG TPA: AAA family ATPase [Terriglobales bacterium]|nr:AAA family ATPase [Terriglobales bacterium]